MLSGAAARLILQLTLLIAMVRFLGPEQYGLFAIGAIVVAFSIYLSDVGIAYRLIQRKNVAREDGRFVFTWQIVLSIAVTALVSLNASRIASLFGEPNAAVVTSSLSAVCLVNALAAPALNLLTRALDFRRLQVSQLIGFVVGNLGVGLPIAAATHSAMAIVAAWTVQAIVTALLMSFVVLAPQRLALNRKFNQSRVAAIYQSPCTAVANHRGFRTIPAGTY
jgi:lipopolysaccharide exporter